MAKEKRTIHLSWEPDDTMTLEMTGTFTVLEGLALLVAAQKVVYASVEPEILASLRAAEDTTRVPVTFGPAPVTFDDTIPDPKTTTRH